MVVNRLGVDEASVLPNTNIVTDLGGDSVGILDLVFDIDRKYGIELPVEMWMRGVNEGEAKLEDYFVLRNLLKHVTRQIEAKALTA